MTNIIAVKVSKGGVGKTTITTNLAHTFSKSGKKVLIIDLDSQGNLSKTFTSKLEPNKMTSSNLLGDEFSKISDYIHEIDDNLDLICADIGLNEVSKYLEKNGDYHNRLKEILRSKNFKKYDLIFLDLSPGVADVLTEVSLISSDLLICPAHFDIDSLTGIILTIEEISNLHEANLLSSELKYLVVPNRYDQRYKSDNDAIFKLIYENLEKEFIAKPIRENSHIKKARMRGVSAIEYEENPNRKYEHKRAIEDFNELSSKVIELLEMR